MGLSLHSFILVLFDKYLLVNLFPEKFRAAYKGFADCIRLLLFLDAYRGRQDKEGKPIIFLQLSFFVMHCLKSYVILHFILL